ncbi:hypothetical protein B566_EDAN009515 [Ephemera danica]|nr:hypothetical protein B566_EDAN009515 [Ephemera danica]
MNFTATGCSRECISDAVGRFPGQKPQGLLKGSTTAAAAAAAAAAAIEANCECRLRPVERPKTLRRIQNVYDNETTPPSKTSMMTSSGADSSTDKSLSILSPFDEQEEWAKISEIMASFGTGLVRESVFVSELEQEFQSESAASPCTPQQPPTSVGQWLATLGLPQYEDAFMKNGYDDLGFIRGVLQPSDLAEMGVTDPEHVSTITDALEQLPQQLQRFGRNGARAPNTVDEWLRAIRLECYTETFRKHLYTDMQRVLRIWDVEVTTLLDIDKLGHRRRILASVGAAAAALADLGRAEHTPAPPPATDTKPATGATLTVPGSTGTLRHSHKKSRPAPPPPQHPPPAQPSNGAEVEELSIRDPAELLKLKRAVMARENKDTPEVVLAISFRGVQFLDAATKELVCEHEIRNIHCACQDADDLTHFAYITKDHSSKDHYCHVFCDQATEVILTLGQAFEVAYQMALREQLQYQPGRVPGHARSQSHAVPRCSSLSNGSTNGSVGSNGGAGSLHTRSHSVNGAIRLDDPPAPISTPPRAPIVFTEDM